MADNQELPPLAVPTWDKDMPLLSQRWLGCAGMNQRHRFDHGDALAQAVHRARKEVYRRCTRDVAVYEDALREKNAEIQRLRARVAALESLASAHERELVAIVKEREAANARVAELEALALDAYRLISETSLNYAACAMLVQKLALHAPEPPKEQDRVR